MTENVLLANAFEAALDEAVDPMALLAVTCATSMLRFELDQPS
jgi:hypothetical protein